VEWCPSGLRTKWYVNINSKKDVDVDLMTLQLLGVSVMDQRLSSGNLASCGNNHLILNMNKTKEMIWDFKRNRIKPNTVSILEEEVEDFTLSVCVAASVGAAASETQRN